MAPRDYENAPAFEALGLGDVIRGLAQDLVDLRARKITPHEALARAALAKQIWNGVRLYLQGSKVIAENARRVDQIEKEKP